MNAIQDHPLVRDYLTRLDAAASDTMGSADAAELRADIEAHLADALPPDPTEAQVRQVLDRLGDPSAVAAEAGGATSPRESGAAGHQTGRIEVAALALLLLAIPLAWLFPVNILLWLGGLGLLLWSRVWSTADKLWGALVLSPAGFVVLAALGYAGFGNEEVCSQTMDGPVECTSTGTAGLGYLVLAAAVIFVGLVAYTLIRLVRSLRRHRAAQGTAQPL